MKSHFMNFATKDCRDDDAELAIISSGCHTHAPMEIKTEGIIVRESHTDAAMNRIKSFIHTHTQSRNRAEKVI